MNAARTAARKAATGVTILDFMGPDRSLPTRKRSSWRSSTASGSCTTSKTIRITDHAVKWVAVERVGAEDGSVSFEDDFRRTGDVEADAVIIAVGQGPASDVPDVGLRLTQSGLLEADEHGRTSRPRVFAAGGIVTGPRTVVVAVAHAERAVEALDEVCRGATQSVVRERTAPVGGAGARRRTGRYMRAIAASVRTRGSGRCCRPVRPSPPAVPR